MIDAAVTLPPCLMRAGAVGFGGGGATGAADHALSGNAAEHAARAPALLITSGGSSASLNTATSFGIARGCISFPDWIKRATGLTIVFTGCGGGGGGGGGGGAISKVESIAFGSASV